MKKILLLICSTAIIWSSYAQDVTVSGRVTSSEDGSPLPGVNVVLKGTTVGTATDADGRYSMPAPSKGGFLVFSFIGLESKEIEIGGRSVVDVSLALDVTQLSEVVVTAQGIQRDKKALGYAVSQVSGESLQQKTEGDVGRLLRGKAPGVNVTQTSGLSGSATNIIIRGYTSITGGNQPLFVVDGVPFNGGTNYQSDFVDGQTESSRFLDIDPNNIEGVSILKGLSATVLYGDRGRNGVILITTKNGSTKRLNKKSEVTFSQSYFVNKIASLPDYQNNYGNGFNQNFGFFFSNWGPHFDEIDVIAHPYSRFTDPELIAAFPEFQGADYEYKPYRDISHFFRDGSTYNTSVNFSGGSDKTTFNVNYGYLNDIGFTPGNGLKRHNFGFGGNAELSNNITVGGTFNIANTNYTSPPVAASFGSGSFSSLGSSVFGDLFYTPRSIDIMGLPFESPIDGRSVYYRSGNDIQNPRWTAKYGKTGQEVNRFFGQTFARYKITDWLRAMYRIGLDTYTEQSFAGQSRGAVDGNINGFYQTTSGTNTIWNHDIIVNLDKAINENFNLRGTLGYNARRDEYYQQGILSSTQVVFGELRHFNFVDHTDGGLEFESSENRIGVYAQAELDYKNFLYLTVAGRNDWSNTLEKGNNSLFYPAASIAADLTSAISSLQNNNFLNYLKVRLAYGTSANFPAPYSTRNTLSLNSRSFVSDNNEVLITNSLSNRLANSDLKPERLSDIEFGIESKVWNDRITFDVSLYKKNTKDLILDQAIDPATNFTVRRVNAGEMEVKGIEATIGANVLKKGGFSWDINANFSSFTNTVVDLPEGTDQIFYGSGFSNLGNFAIKGESFGAIQGSYIRRDANGNRLVDDQGLYIISNDIKIIGNPIPDWTGGITNTFSYKGIALNVEIQYVHGGDIYSRTANNLVGRGITKDTDFDRRKTFVLPGVYQDGSPNTTAIAATQLYFDVFGFGADELQIYDGTTIRLNEVSLSYQIPKAILSKTPFGALSFSATGYNLWYKAVNFPEHVNFDTNSIGTGVGNGIGLDFINSPSSKRYGVSMRLTF